MKLSVKVPLTPQLILALKWWLLDQNIAMGRPVQKDQYLVTVTTDASGKWGWGSHGQPYLSRSEEQSS